MSVFPPRQPVLVTNSLSFYLFQDTELGKDSVCWRSHNYMEDPTLGQHTYFPNPLIPSFQLGGRVELLTSCPTHLNVSVFAPTEFTDNKDIVGWRPRTKTEYNFTISGTIDLHELEGDTLVSDFGSTILVQIILCKLGSSGFCSPFVSTNFAFLRFSRQWPGRLCCLISSLFVPPHITGSRTIECQKRCCGDYNSSSKGSFARRHTRAFCQDLCENGTQRDELRV
jgi:hypothetical protein